VAPLPAGDDPDSIVRKNGQSILENSVKTARPAVDHFIERAFADTTQSIEDKVRAAHGLWPLFQAMGQSLERDLYLARLAEKVGVSSEQLEQRLIAVEQAERKAKRPLAASTRVGGAGSNRGSRARREGSWGLGNDDGSPADYDGPPQYDGPPLDDARSSLVVKPTPPPKPKVDRAELAMFGELLLYPTLRPRFSELLPFASEGMRHILEDLIESQDPVVAVLARHAVPQRILRRASVSLKGAGAGMADVSLNVTSVAFLANGIVAEGSLPVDPKKAAVASATLATATENADYLERANKTFEDILVESKRRAEKVQEHDLMHALKDAMARGDDTEELAKQVRDSKLRTRRKR
ncbi:MAG: hypothetical protein H7Z43_08580, partial [Clostridia bacterium]|nr:hypothetical protein [Deltaproteobacteria bacterium]